MADDPLKYFNALPTKLKVLVDSIILNSCKEDIQQAQRDGTLKTFEISPINEWREMIARTLRPGDQKFLMTPDGELSRRHDDLIYEGMEIQCMVANAEGEVRAIYERLFQELDWLPSPRMAHWIEKVTTQPRGDRSI